MIKPPFARWTALAWTLMLGACAGGGAPDSECRPLDYHCEGKTLYDCRPDVDLLRQGAAVYMWQEVDVCEGSSPIPNTVYACIEHKVEGGRIEAGCEIVPAGTR